MAPTVSVVIAAHGRSNVLRRAIESVQIQTFPDWELLVVDDCSPDDTSTVVEGIDDPRVRLVRMAQNFGEQSGPNNLGVLLAAAPLIALLNQDDVWFPDHLESLLRLKGDCGAGLVYGMQAVAPDGAERTTYTLVGSRPVYDPRFEARGSSWLLDRDLHLALGGWRPAASLRLESSNHFLFRAWRAGADPTPSQHLTVLAESSGSHLGSYARRIDDFQSQWMRDLAADPDGLRRRILAQAVPHDPSPGPGAPLAARLADRAKSVVARGLAGAGLPPREVFAGLKGRRPGQHIRDLRRSRGLPDR